MIKTIEYEYLISIRKDKEKERVLEIALSYLPPEVAESFRDRLAIFTITQRRGIRLSPQLFQKFEVIFLSDEIFPRVGGFEHEDDFRYFTFIVLHEVAHAYLKHECPYFDQLSEEAIQKNEREATAAAIDWFNVHVSGNEETNQKLFKEDEIKLFELSN